MMNYTEYLEYLENLPDKELTITVEGKIPQCPPGYIFNRKKMDCVPKTKRDSVKGRLNDKDNSHKTGASYNVWGRTGLNGDGMAYEDPPLTDVNATHGEPI